MRCITVADGLFWQILAMIVVYDVGGYYGRILTEWITG